MAISQSLDLLSRKQVVTTKAGPWLSEVLLVENLKKSWIIWKVGKFEKSWKIGKKKLEKLNKKWKIVWSWIIWLKLKNFKKLKIWKKLENLKKVVKFEKSWTIWKKFENLKKVGKFVKSLKICKKLEKLKKVENFEKKVGKVEKKMVNLKKVLKF